MSKGHHHSDLGMISPGLQVWLAENPSTDTAIVFVHGFKGHPITTWTDFPGIADQGVYAEDWESSDLYFFDYHDVMRSIDDSSDDLETFLNSIYPQPIPIVQSNCRATRKVKGGQQILYSKLILVGHSEGGVVLRACIAEIGKKSLQSTVMSPVLDSRLALFAPALYGFLPTSWLGLVTLHFPIKQITEIIVTWSKAAAELRDTGTLEQIERDTSELHKRLPERDAFVAHVVFGLDESVVRKQRYFQDIKYTAVQGKDHRTICKPTSDYQWPLRFVKGAS